MSVSTCLFCKIASGEEKSFIVYEDAMSVAFLDKRPLFAGHCLLIPKTHIATFADLPTANTGEFFKSAQSVAKAIESAMEAEGSFIGINNRVSQSVPHLHVHIVPRRKKDGLKGFFWPRHPYKSEEEMREVQLKIIKFLQQN